jgi:hypothetical protein
MIFEINPGRLPSLLHIHRLISSFPLIVLFRVHITTHVCELTFTKKTGPRCIKTFSIIKNTLGDETTRDRGVNQ